METALQTELPSDTPDLVASPWHTMLIIGVIAVLVFRGKLQAEHLRTASNANHILLYGRIILSECLTLAFVLAGVWFKGVPLRSVLGDRWSSILEFLRDVGIGILFVIATIVVTSVLGGHGGATDKATQFLLPSGGLEIALWILVSISAGICEEAIYRGYLQKQFAAISRSIPVGIAFSAAAFGLSHYYQGWSHAVVIGLTGAMAGGLAYWRRTVRPGMIAHALQDVLGGLLRH